jgi:hypothetical protein
MEAEEKSSDPQFPSSLFSFVIPAISREVFGGQPVQFCSPIRKKTAEIPALAIFYIASR